MELMTMIAVEYYTLGEYATSLQISGQTLSHIPSDEKYTLESVARKQVNSFLSSSWVCLQSL